MAICIITGVGGLIGSEATRFFIKQGFSVVGIDNNMREQFFGPEASVQWNIDKLKHEYDERNFINFDIDICDTSKINDLFESFSDEIGIVIHTAAQPSHDWAVKSPLLDFQVNAYGTLNLLEATKKYAPEASFIFCSTNKVYGDNPNKLDLYEFDSRMDVSVLSKYYNGIDESMSIDNCIHSLFGCSKLSADAYVQEYGKNFGMNTAVFRGGCLTGANHSSAELHGFLAYLVKCIVKGKKYTIFGRKGKTVRDNISSRDVITAFWENCKSPHPGEVYNIGGCRENSVSMLEAIKMIEKIANKKAIIEYSDKARVGDHIWYISNMDKFKGDYPNWVMHDKLYPLLSEMVEVAHKV